MDNKSIKNQTEMASSHYPPRSSSKQNVAAEQLFAGDRL